MRNLAASGFVLIGPDGDQSLAPASGNGPYTVDVTQMGAAGLIRALLGDGDVYAVRDPSAPPVIEPGEGRIHLQTSGTTGTPKWRAHEIAKLTQDLFAGSAPARWLLTFNPGSFAGVQVILSALIGGHVLIAPPYEASVAEMADLAMQHQATHISGTPTFWRAFLMALGDRPLDLKAVTLGGEAADQAILDALRQRFPKAALRHIYATTEAGRVLTVSDGCEGFPLSLLTDRLTLSEHGTLCVGGLDTGDVVEIVGDRVLFRGRLDSMVNIGGVKVFPETVEAFILQHPGVQDVRVASRPNPITGHVLTADMVLKPFADQNAVKAHLQGLPRAQRPVMTRFVETLPTGQTGKKLR
ncbi:MAG TPA: class I adenylate-forming enzyme family protein [Asticcacaulis sp.]|nr:class I adenylate-forming enzyme family protein [Asticcacaulis sp.]